MDSSSTAPPEACALPSENCSYKLQWRREWLMDFDPIKNQMICMLCFKRLESLKLDTIKKHHRSRHNGLDLVEYPTSKKMLLVLKHDAE